MRITAEAAERKRAEGAARSAPAYFDGADNQAPTVTADPPPCGYRLTSEQHQALATRLALLGIAVDAPAAGGAFVSMAQRAEPLIPLVLDERGSRHLAVATAMDSGCPDPAPSPPASERPKAPDRCVQPRTVPMKLPKVRGKRVSVRVRAGGKRVRVRRGVAYVRVREKQRGRRVKVRIVQRYRRGGETRVKRTRRVVRVCASRS